MSDVRWLSPDQQQVWRSYIAMVRLINEALERQMHADSDMSLGDYVILMQLSEAPDRRMRMRELADSTVSSRSRLSHAVARLETNGWITRSPCDDDGRGTWAQLTDDGFATLAAAAPGHATTVHDLLFAPLGEQRWAELGSIIDTIIDAMPRTPDAS